MKKSFHFSLFILVLFSLVVLSGCATLPPITQYKTETRFDLADNSQSKQTQEGITIELKPLNQEKEYAKSYYTQEFKVSYIPFLSKKPVLQNKDIAIQFFKNYLPFEVKIINNTNHILRMRDSRVLFIDPSSDEPIMALDKSTILDDLESLPVYTDINNLLAEKYPYTAIEEITKSLTKVVKKLKFVNAFNREIMPGMKYSGLILFPIDPVEAAEGKVSFIDMVSKTDAAGNPTKKVRFDYRVKPVYKYFQYNEATDKDWIEIDKSKYETGKGK